MLKIGYNAVWEGEESLIPLIFSSPAVRAVTDLYCSNKWVRKSDLSLDMTRIDLGESTRDVDLTYERDAE